MVTRQNFILSAAALAGTAVATETYLFEKDKGSYAAAAAELRRPFTPSGQTHAHFQSELVRYATLATSNHNAQPWKFLTGENDISIFPDLARRTLCVDPDDHHLFASLGCAAENLVQAALAQGLKGNLTFNDTEHGELHIGFEPTAAVVSPLYQAITQRQCTRTEFDGRAIAAADMAQLVKAGTGSGVHVLLLTDRQAIEQILGYVLAGNKAEMNSGACVAELKAAIRFNDHAAVKSGDGLFSRTTGNLVLPTWVGNLLFSSFYKLQGENDKYASQIRSSAGIAIFISEKDDRAHWIQAGRCYERFALQATALGIRNALVNQPVEVAVVRSELATHLGIAQGRCDLVARFGRGPEMPQSLRRPVEAVLL